MMARRAPSCEPAPRESTVLVLSRATCAPTASGIVSASAAAAIHLRTMCPCGCTRRASAAIVQGLRREIQVVVSRAPRIERGVATRTPVAAREVLVDRELRAAGAAQHRLALQKLGRGADPVRPARDAQVGLLGPDHARQVGHMCQP